MSINPWNSIAFDLRKIPTSKSGLWESYVEKSKIIVATSNKSKLGGKVTCHPRYNIVCLYMVVQQWKFKAQSRLIPF